MVVLLANFCQNLTYSKDSSWAGVTHQNTQIGMKSGSGYFPTPRFPSPDLESRAELWPWWRGLKRSHHILWRPSGRHVNIWRASQCMGALWVWNTSRGHGRRKNWPLCHWAWLGGADRLKGQVCRSVLKVKEKKAGSFVSVKHGKRAWQTKELVRKEPFAKLHMTIFCTAPSLQELVSH